MRDRVFVLRWDVKQESRPGPLGPGRAPVNQCVTIRRLETRSPPMDS